VRRSRDRFWAGERDAIDTLHTVLELTCRLAAPLLPLTTEAIWRGLTGQRSVHLTDWPDPTGLPQDHDLVASMDRVRQVVSTALSLRKARGLRVRQPLSRLTVAAPDAMSLVPLLDLIRDEVNVKTVELTGDVAAHGRFELTVNARACGPRLGGDTQKVIRAVRDGDWERGSDGVVSAAGIPLLDGEYTERLVAADPAEAAALPAGSGLVVLDTALTPELVTEGIAKDLVRVVQQARKRAGLDVTDRVELTVDAPEEVIAAARAHEEFIAGEVLSRSIDYAPLPEAHVGTVGDGVEVRVALVKA
jgi:isoleucyl-tRNA synthetase